MALSEEEQRLLEQLEASLMAEDPKLAHTLGDQGVTPRQIHTKRATGAGIIFVLGVIALVVGLKTIWVVSVLGFLAMFAATVIALTAWQKVAPSSPKKTYTPSASAPFTRHSDEWWHRGGN